MSDLKPEMSRILTGILTEIHYPTLLTPTTPRWRRSPFTLSEMRFMDSPSTRTVENMMYYEKKQLKVLNPTMLRI
jgi:hypothetical protein